MTAVATAMPGLWRKISSLALVRLVLMTLILLGADVVLQIALWRITGHLPVSQAASVGLVGAIVSALALLLVYAGLVRLFEHRKASELALGPGLAWVGLGVVIGFGLFCALYAIFFAIGVAHWNGLTGAPGLGPAVVAAIVAAIGEEVIFRGVVFRVIEDSLGTWLAVAISAAIFGLLHAGNPGATAVSTAAIALEAGVLLSMAYAFSRNLWLPIGLHFGWNFTEGGVFGAAVSGRGYHGLVSAPLSAKAPELITGGGFGPEASVFAVAVCLGAALALGVAAARAGRWKPLSFRMILA
jgi:membrane protease YdiL (CAAX protease family)